MHYVQYTFVRALESFADFAQRLLESRYPYSSAIRMRWGHQVFG